MSKRKDPAAVKLGRKGGTAAAGKGAAKKWAAMTPEQRSAHNRDVAIKGWVTRREREEK
jgi:hypothetical protein